MSDHAALKITGALLIGFGALTVGLGAIAANTMYATGKLDADAAVPTFFVGGGLIIGGLLMMRATPSRS